MAEALGGPRIDLNSSTVHDLLKLPGMDSMLARRIVMDRKLYGQFQTIADLTRVEGVSQALLETLSSQAELSTRTEAQSGGRLRVVAAPDAPEPIVFAGTPELFRGELMLANDGDAMLHGVVMRLENTNFRTAEGVPLRYLRLPVSLAPAAQKKVSVHLSLEPTTPPGIYQAGIETGEQRIPVTLVVSEHRSVTVNPVTVEAVSTPGAKIETSIVIHNQGNVTLTLEDLGGVPLEEVDMECRIIRETVRRTKNPTWDEFVGAAATEAKKTFAHFDVLRVRVKEKPVTIPPGGTAILTIQSQIPKNVHPARRYRGRVRIFDTSISFELQPAMRPESDQPDTAE
jgi:hypothetical protein